MDTLHKRIAYLRQAIEVCQDNDTLADLDTQLQDAEDELLLIEMEKENDSN
ncbi:MAG: hypothetical protein IPL26_13180 [Leptospiraceae bacterium]|nr:hypothetical protein [Leptospiraceae bacterium]MBK8396176.1 hypothetical protein [Leptospiraceae bacterium]